ncbi:MAG TPA: electron transfer flavoprotein subunit alpha/FixB family protein [Candidatus Koribacter sp.]|jgi:electron transfer flavoprotein alpha subunit
MNPIFIVALHQAGLPDDSVGELISVAKVIDPSSAPTALACGYGAELDSVCTSLRPMFREVWKLANEHFTGSNSEAMREALVAIVPKGSIVLLAHEHFGLDLAPGLSIKLNASYVPDVIAVEEGLKLIRQEFNGQFSVRMECDLSAGAVITIRPGCFKATSTASAEGVVIDKSAAIPTMTLHRRYITTIPAQVGDVDITKQTVLVSVGRGIQDQENIGLAEELASVLGGAVSCSRPVVDAKWLEKSRQVGSSGATVSPKVYLACGISGSFQHMTGIKGAPFLVAINKNPGAPIFQFADIGIVDDVLEFLPVLTERVREVLAGKGAAVAAR